MSTIQTIFKKMRLALQRSRPLPVTPPTARLSMLDYNQLRDFQGDTDKKFRHLWRLVGNTPMIEILYRFGGRVRTLYAKCEQYNLAGSIKDRCALHQLQTAYTQKIIRPYSRIMEVGNGHSAVSPRGHWTCAVSP